MGLGPNGAIDLYLKAAGINNGQGNLAFYYLYVAAVIDLNKLREVMPANWDLNELDAYFDEGDDTAPWMPPGPTPVPGTGSGTFDRILKVTQEDLKEISTDFFQDGFFKEGNSYEDSWSTQRQVSNPCISKDKNYCFVKNSSQATLMMRIDLAAADKPNALNVQAGPGDSIGFNLSDADPFHVPTMNLTEPFDPLDAMTFRSKIVLPPEMTLLPTPHLDALPIYDSVLNTMMAGDTKPASVTM